MFASILLLSSIAFSAFLLASFACINVWTLNDSAENIAIAVAQYEAARALSAYIAHNQPVNVEMSDLEYLGGDYDPTDCPDSSCLFDALAMFASLAYEEKAEKQPATPHIVESRPWDDSDTALAHEWDGYRRFRAFNADFPRVIRPDVAYVASAENAAFKADNPACDDWFPRWCGATT